MEKILCCSLNPFSMSQPIVLCDSELNKSQIIASVNLNELPRVLSEISNQYMAYNINLYGPTQLLETIADDTFEYNFHTYHHNDLNININP